MKIECKYGQVYYTDLHPGEKIPNGTGGFIELTSDDIDEYGRLKNNIKLSNEIVNEYYDDLTKKFEQEDEETRYLIQISLAVMAFNTALTNLREKKKVIK